MRYKRRVMAGDVSWFLGLEEELGLFGKITLSFLCAGNGGGVAHIPIFGDEILGAHAGFVSQIRICSEREIGFSRK